MRLDTSRRIKRITLAFLLIGWGVAWGSAASVPPDLIGMPWLQLLVGMMIATWGGAAATLDRYLRAAYDNRPFHWRAEALRDLFVSFAVGAGTYWAGWAYKLGTPEVSGLVLMAGYGGTRVLSLALSRAFQQGGQS